MRKRHWGVIQAMKDRRGSTAVEFSLLAVPFMLMIIGIIELALIYVNSSVLEGAAQDAGRLIRTGQIQAITDPEDAEEVFRAAMCDHASALINCDNIQYRVTTLESFSGANVGFDLDEDGNLDDPDFNSGGSGDVIMIQVLYYYPLMTPVIGQYFSDSPDNTRLLTSTIVLQVEPYDLNDEGGV